MEKSQCPFIIKIVNQEKKGTSNLLISLWSLTFFSCSFLCQKNRPHHFIFIFSFCSVIQFQTKVSVEISCGGPSQSSCKTDRLQGQLPLAYISNKPQNTEQAKSTAPNN